MGESQSRYGIIEELNNRKINVKEKLSNIERETDNYIYTKEKEIKQMKSKIQLNESTYESKHEDKIRELQVELKMLSSDFERKKLKIETSIEDRKENYKQNFKDWKELKEKAINFEEEQLTRYKTVQTAKVEEKKSIITEIENGIADLKEVSKESTKE